MAGENRGSFRASSLGSCPRALVAENLGFTPIAPPRAAELRMAEGNLHEPDVIGRLRRDHNWMLGHQQQEVWLTVTDSLKVSGHPDAIRLRRSTGEMNAVVEVKAMSRDAWATKNKHGWDTRNGLHARWQWQISVYMLALGLPAWFVAKNRDSGEIVMEKIDEPFHSLDEVRSRVLMLDSWIRRGELPPDCDAGMGWTCPFRYLHDEPLREKLADEEIDALARTLVDARDERKVAEEKERSARKMLMDGLGDLARKVETASGVHVTKFETSRAVWDYDQMEHDGIDVSKYKKVSKSWQVRVSVPQQLEVQQ